MVLEAALAIADERELESLTMSAVADRLGVTSMALYRHVSNKADLLDGIVELLLAETSPTLAESPFEDRLAQLARSVRDVARRHPAVFLLLLQRPAVTPAALSARDAVCRALVEAGLDTKEAAQMERLLSTAVLGFAASEAGGRFARHSRRQIDADFDVLLEMLRLTIVTRVADATPSRR